MGRSPVRNAALTSRFMDSLPDDRCVASFHRLLEVPYLPRAADPSWKRRRFGRPKWVRWAWVVLGIAAVTILVTGSIRFLRKHHDSALKRSIQRLLETSRQHEDAGDLNQALIDLDAAMDLAQQSNPAGISELAEYQTRRRALAQRKVEATLERLVRRDQSSFSLGDWLNLIARLPHDPDLAPLVDPIEKQFVAAVRREGIPSCGPPFGCSIRVEP